MTSVQLVGSVTQSNIEGSSSGPGSATFDPSGMWVYSIGKKAAATGVEINVVDVSDPTTPTIDSTISRTVEDQPLGACVGGGHLWVTCSSGHLLVYSIATPGSPSFVTSHSHSNWANMKSIVYSGGYLYGTRAGVGAAAGLFTCDVSTPSAPSFVDSDSIGTGSAQYVREVTVAGGYAHTHAPGFFAKLLSLATASNPSESGSYLSPSLLPGGGVFDGTRWGYLVSSDGRLRSLDWSSLPTPTVHTTGPGTASSARAIYLDGAHLILLAGSVEVWSVTTPSAPTLEASASGFNYDWASDYHAGRRLTAGFDYPNTCRLDIGRVAFRGWTVGAVVF